MAFSVFFSSCMGVVLVLLKSASGTREGDTAKDSSPALRSLPPRENTV